MRELIVSRIVHNRCDPGEEQVLRYSVTSKGLIFHRDLELAGSSIKTSYYYRVLVRNMRLGLVQDPGFQISPRRQLLDPMNPLLDLAHDLVTRDALRKAKVYRYPRSRRHRICG